MVVLLGANEVLITIMRSILFVSPHNNILPLLNLELVCSSHVTDHHANSWVAVHRHRTGTLVTVVMSTAIITVKLNYIYIV